MPMRKTAFIAACGALVACFASFAMAGQGKVNVVSVTVQKEKNAVVAELFTSQGCSSCPPADAFLGELAHRADVIPIEMHVDYWDDSDTPFGGKWKDPFSSPAWTQRQQAYNRLILGSKRVFTPQMVIDGRLQQIGTRRQAVFSDILQAKTLRKKAFDISPVLSAKGDVTVTVKGPGLFKAARVELVRLTHKVRTHVTAGENNGAELVNRNIATEMLSLGTYGGGKESYHINLDAGKDGADGCVVMLQNPEDLHVLSAALCETEEK